MSMDRLDRPRVGPKAAEDEIAVVEDGRNASGGMALRAVLPNAITAAALCSGLTGIRFAISEDWAPAIIAVILAGLLDGIDGRVARLLKAQSRFGAEMDSLADSLSFGMAPALILYLWSLQELPRLGWFASLAFALCCALRLARFNAQIDADEQPHKSAGFLTGIPAPVAAGLAFLPFYIWMETGLDWLRDPIVVGIWLAVIAVLMISNVATLTWASLRPRRNVRLGVIGAVGLLFAGMLLEPWWALTAICLAYLALMPLGIVRYSRVKRRRKLASEPEPKPREPFDVSGVAP